MSTYSLAAYYPVSNDPHPGLPAIRAGAASGVLQMIEQNRADGDRLLADQGLARADLEIEDRQIALAAYCGLFEQAARATGLEGFGLRFGHGRFAAITGMIGRLTLAAPTLGAGLRWMSHYFPAWQESSVVVVEQRDGMVHLSYQIRDGRIVARRQDAELTISAFMDLLRHVLGPGWTPDEVQFEHPGPRDGGDHADILGAPVTFGATTNAIVFRAESLKALMPTPAPAAIPLLRLQLERRLRAVPADDTLGLVRQEIRAGLTAGTAAMPQVARRLGMAPATLHRRLQQRGALFSDLTAAMRQELALDQLAQPHISLTEIAALLGYAELSVFSRAFKKWTGIAPREWRRARAVE